MKYRCLYPLPAMIGTSCYTISYPSHLKEEQDGQDRKRQDVKDVANVELRR